GHVIRKSAEDLSNILHSGILPKDVSEIYLESCEPFRTWKLRGNYKDEIWLLERLLRGLKGLYKIHKRKPLRRDIGKMYRLANTIWHRFKWPGEPIKKLTKAEENLYNSAKEFHNMSKFDGHLISQAMGRATKEAITAIPHNMENYLSFDIGDQRYMDSLQIMGGSLDSHVSNLGAEPCKDLGAPCKKREHLYRIDEDRCFAHPERFPMTQAYTPKHSPEL
ncbi:7045_t:CDS:2, partial [Gigaspora margarita]